MRKWFISVLLAVVLFGSGLYVGAQNAVTIPTFTPGQILTAAELNALGDVASQLQNKLILLQDDVTRLESLTAGHLTIFDANGVTIGESIGLSFQGNPIVSMSIEGQVVVLGVREDGFFNVGRVGPYFDGLDCTGIPLITRRETENNLLTIVKVNAPGQTLYIEDSTAVDEIEVQSLLFQDFADPRVSGCFNTGGFTGVSVIPLLDLDTLFTPPFTVVRKGG